MGEYKKRQVPRRIYLIVDRHPVHRAGAVKKWVGTKGRRVRLFYLPGYRPDLNPDEYLNQDVKSNAVVRRRYQERGREQTPLQDEVVTVFKQGPTESRLLGPPNVFGHGRAGQPQARRRLPGRQPQPPSQSQDVFDLSHR